MYLLPAYLSAPRARLPVLVAGQPGFPGIGNAIGRAYLPHLTVRQASHLIRRLVG